MFEHNCAFNYYWDSVNDVNYWQDEKGNSYSGDDAALWEFLGEFGTIESWKN